MTAHISWPPSAQTQREYTSAFGPFNGHVSLNAAHQGPLPRVAVDAAEEALREKAAPHLIRDEAFIELPLRLRRLFGQLIGAPAEEIILGNSASWGLQILANGLPWHEGDEVLVLADEFPATVFPWLVAERDGVTVRQLELGEPVLHPERLEAGIDVALRAGNIRLSPHLYNTFEEIDRAAVVMLGARPLS